MTISRLHFQKGEAKQEKLSFKLRIEEVARNIAEFCGFSQAMTYSFESPKVFDKLLLPEDSELRKAVEIMNPWRGLQHYADNILKWNAYFTCY